LLFQDEVKGNIIEMADEVMDYLRGKYLYAPVHYEGMQRVEELEIPETALRELLYNAIVHRDYRGVHTQMKVYDDRIRLWNDGILPDGYNLQSLIEEHSSYVRNKLIANAFYIAGFIENWGRGIEKVQEEFAAAALPMPVFETNSGGVLVTIPRGNITKNVTKTIPNNTLVNNEIVEQHITKNITKNITKSITKSITKTTPITLSGAALKVVRMIEKNPNITTAQMAEVIGVAKRNLIAFTNNLQRDGIIRHIGPARGGHWEVTI
jgi:ATP-dependent DNA helicase RecG